MSGRNGALAAHPDQGGSHAAFLDWQQGAVDDHEGGQAAGGEIAGLLTNIPHNVAGDEDADANDAQAHEAEALTAAAAPPAAPARPAVATLQRLAEATLTEHLTVDNVVSVLTLASNVNAPALAEACAAFASAHLAAVVQTEYFDDLPSGVRRRLLLCAAQGSNPVGAAPGTRNAFFEPREFLGIVHEHVVELRERLADAERAQAEAVARAAAAARTRRRAASSGWTRLFSFGGGGGGASGRGAARRSSGVEYAAEKIVLQRRHVARVEQYHAAQSKLFAALEPKTAPP